MKITLKPIQGPKTFKVVSHPRTEQQGLFCSICNIIHYTDYSITKKYCPKCNIYHEYANYLSFV